MINLPVEAVPAFGRWAVVDAKQIEVCTCEDGDDARIIARLLNEHYPI